ncbi:MAG: metal ABC transporter permease [Phycisphaerales bacterium]|nr:metal ABC transporter permease [Phycisphaerales bacterium]
MNDFLRLITLQDANTRTVLLGTGSLGLAAGVIGALAVLRRRALVGDALAHAALPGVCVAFLVFRERSLPLFLLGALVFGVLGVLTMNAIRRFTRIKEDAAIAIVLGSFFGLGIMLSGMIQRLPSGNRAGLDSFLFGKAAGMVHADLLISAAACILALLGVAALYKELKLVGFDREFAGSLGWPVGFLDLTLMALLAIVTVVGLPAVGVVLMAALLIIPGVTAKFWTDRLAPHLALAGLFGMLSGLLGSALSAVLPSPNSSMSRGFPTGPLIVLVAGTLFVGSLLFAPRRGLVARWRTARLLQQHIDDEHLLRDLYELQEAGTPASLSTLAERRTWRTGSLHAALRRALTNADVTDRNAVITLTASGLTRAVRVIRSHRLWELYLHEHAGVAPDHVDRDADLIEHFITPNLLAKFEAQLALGDADPLRTGAALGVPLSLHPPGENAR